MTLGNIEEWFRRYLEVFSTLDLEATVAHYHAPMIMVIPGGVVVMNDENEVRSTFGMIFAQYEAAGYGRSEVLDLESRYLGAGLAEVGGTAARHDTRGREMSRFDFRYVMRQDGESWKIAAMVNGDPVSGPGPDG